MSDVEATSKSGPIRFSPTIELGHLLQALVILGAIGGWALLGYQSVQKTLDQQAAEMALFKQRLTADEAAAAQLRTDLQQMTLETRQGLGKISDQISDLRAAVGNGAVHR